MPATKDSSVTSFALERGNDNQIVYLHGMPGGSAELGLFGSPVGNSMFVLDRFQGSEGEDRFESMTQAIIAHYPKSRIRLVAFSLGTRPALEIARRLGTRVSGIDLIAPAAPLTPQDRNMAGYPVFTIARNFPLLFYLLTAAQATLAHRAPSVLFRGLFKSAQGADLALSHDTAFRNRVTKMLGTCFADGGRAYRTEVNAYVVPWSQLLARVPQPVTLWHGTLDNWAPISMSERLRQQLPNAVALHRLEGLSHYTSLETALRAIFGDFALAEVADNA